MGITGLLPFLKDASTEVHLKDLSGTVAVIDTYCWLHKSLIGKAFDVYERKNVTAHIDFCVKKIDTLKSYNIKPVFVFDGQNLPAKSETENSRRKKREQARIDVEKFIAKGDHKTAFKIAQRCIDISQEMAKQLIDVLIEKEVDFLVAPYEADVQIAYLVKNKFAHFAISEDSDLILYGCDYILYKLNSDNYGDLVSSDLVLNCLGNESDKFDFTKFKRMCILSGCDYLSNLPGIGLAKAKKFFASTKDEKIDHLLPKLPKVLKMQKLEVPATYIEKFIEAENTFDNQLIFCPKNKKLRPINNNMENYQKDLYPYAGSYFDNNLALNFAFGNVDFKKMKVFDKNLIENLEIKYFTNEKSIWSPNYHLEEKDKIKKVVTNLKKSLFQCPEVLNKRKFDGNEKLTSSGKKQKKNSDKSPEKLSLSGKKFKKPKITPEKSIKKLDFNSFDNDSEKKFTKISPKKEDKNVIVKSRYFSQNYEKTNDNASLDSILERRKSVREKIKQIYSNKASSSQASYDSYPSSQSQ